MIDKDILNDDQVVWTDLNFFQQWKLYYLSFEPICSLSHEIIDIIDSKSNNIRKNWQEYRELVILLDVVNHEKSFY